MNKNNRAILGKHKIRAADQVSRMQAISESVRMQRMTKRKFGLRVLASDTRHHSGSSGAIDNVGHATWPRRCKVVYTDCASPHSESDVPATFGVVDLFAGPGGLGEGFSSLVENGHTPFRIGISVEKEASAHRTLSLRAFLREYVARYHTLPCEYRDWHAGMRAEVDWQTVDSGLWRKAANEARCLELGSQSAAEAIDLAIAALRRDFDDTILIGGPPCQAYSLVGRARAKGKVGYVREDDPRHYLFREYIRVLDRLRPAVFVMENVKGMLSSTVESRLVFEMLMEDLASLGTGRGHHYELRAICVDDGSAHLVEPLHPSDFVVRAELFGVPQRRHRVIVVGVRADIATGAEIARTTLPKAQSTVLDAIGNLPRLRSGLSRSCDDFNSWRSETISAARFLADWHAWEKKDLLRDAFLDLATRIQISGPLPRSDGTLPSDYGKSDDSLMCWLERPGLVAIAQHETRLHMAADLRRYLFVAAYGGVTGYSPRAESFPLALSPDHRNWQSGDFRDRFRVQLYDEPATTITSHISKDGHYFIHPDPVQCRSLTVREVARLQTFPDDYVFMGSRTQQYVQVGNAVPPYLARQIAALINRVLNKGVASYHDSLRDAMREGQAELTW